MRKAEVNAIANKVYRNLHKELDKRQAVLKAAYENSSLKKRVDAIVEQEKALNKEKAALGYNENKYYFDNNIHTFLINLRLRCINLSAKIKLKKYFR